MVGPWPLDSTPDPAEVRASLAAAVEAGAHLASCGPALPLMAGWARRELRLKPGLPLAGYGDRHSAPSTGQTEPLHARAIALRTDTAGVVILAVDLLLVNRSLAEAVEARVRREMPDPPPIFFTATHTHSGPGGWGALWLEEKVAGDFDEVARDSLADDLASAVSAAWNHLHPSEVAWVRAAAPEGVRNRTVPNGPVDPALEALVVRRSTDRALAVLAVYGAHATCLGSDNLRYAGDYPSGLVRRLEADEEIEFAAFAAGCVGSQAPEAPGTGMPEADALASLLAQRLLPPCKRATFRSEVRLAALRRSIPLPSLQPRIGESTRLSPWAAGCIHADEAMFGLLRIDNILWLGLPMELSALLSIGLRESSALRGSQLALTCFSGDYVGYVVPDDVYADGSRYESQLNFLGPRGGSFTSRLIEEIIRSAADGSP